MAPCVHNHSRQRDQHHQPRLQSNHQSPAGSPFGASRRWSRALGYGLRRALLDCLRPVTAPEACAGPSQAGGGMCRGVPPAPAPRRLPAACSSLRGAGSMLCDLPQRCFPCPPFLLARRPPMHAHTAAVRLLAVCCLACAWQACGADDNLCPDAAGNPRVRRFTSRGQSCETVCTGAWIPVTRKFTPVTSNNRALCVTPGSDGYPGASRSVELASQQRGSAVPEEQI